MDVRQIAAGPGFAVHSVYCTDDHSRWSAPEKPGNPGLVLVRRGRFRRRSRGVEIDLDRSGGYLRPPGTEEVFAHPAGGDVCTWISLAPELWRDLQAEVDGGIYVDARLELAHRRLLVAARSGPVDDALDAVLELFALALGRAASLESVGPGNRRRSSRDAALASAAKQAVLADDPASASLTSLAALLDVSPCWLSRVFSHEVGVPLTRFRNRVRVGRSMARLQGGEQNLAALAADLGFADQAHLCRTMRQHLGRPPRSVAALLRDQGSTEPGVRTEPDRRPRP